MVMDRTGDCCVAFVAVFFLACASTTPRTVAASHDLPRRVEIRGDSGTPRVSIPPSRAGRVPHGAETVFAAADPALSLPGEERVEALRNEALASGVESGAIRITTCVHGEVTLVGWSEHDPAVDSDPGVPSGDPVSDEIPAHAFAWLVADDGAVLDLRTRLDSRDRQGEALEDDGTLRGSLRSLRLDGDPRRETARLLTEDTVLAFVRLARGRFTVVDGCPFGGRGIVVPSVCGLSVRCAEHVAWNGIESPSGDLATEDACSVALGRIRGGAQEAIRQLAETTDAERHGLVGSDDEAEYALVPQVGQCRRVSTAVMRAMTSRFVAIARRTPDQAGFDPADARIRFGCMDRVGNYLVSVANEVSSYKVLFRAGHGAPRQVSGELGRHLMLADFTGDGAPEVIFRLDSAWWVFSPSWPDGLVFPDGSARSGRRFVVVMDGARAGLLLEGEVRAWNGSTFAPVTQGFEALRHALDVENDAVQRLVALDTALLSESPRWAAVPASVCDDATRVAWASDVLHRLRELGVAREDALHLAAEPVGIASCGLSSAWARASAAP